MGYLFQERIQEVVKNMRDFLMRKVSDVSLLFFLVLYTATASGLDNPDAPDYINEFLIQANRYEEKLTQGIYGTQGYVSAYAEYEGFLDKELNRAYRILMGHLDRNSQVALKNSQRKWLNYRDAEFDFITLNWNKIAFGSSSTISKGDYRTTIVKHRVISLFHYLKNYSP